MKTNNVTGRNYVVIMGIYLIAKVFVNMIIGGGGLNFSDLIFAVVAFLAMYSGLKLINYAVAILLGLTVIKHLQYNVTHLPSTLIYLIEGIIDTYIVVLLLTKSQVKAHFTNKLSELFK